MYLRRLFALTILLGLTPLVQADEKMDRKVNPVTTNVNDAKCDILPSIWVPRITVDDAKGKESCMPANGRLTGAGAEMRIEPASPCPNSSSMNLADVIALVSSGISDEIILNQIHTTGAAFRLGTEDILFLKKNKVSDAIILLMQNTREKAMAPAVEPSPKPIAAAATPIEGNQPAPAVDFPDRKIRYMTLSEAIAIALEQGSRGSQTVTISGLHNDTNGGRAFVTHEDLSGSSRVTSTGDDPIRVFALDPAIVGDYFDRDVNVLLFNVESAYWSLYANYVALYAQEQGMRQAYITWQLATSEHDTGKKTDYELAQVRAAFAQFRQQRIDSLQYLLESERQLRGILGMPLDDGARLIPLDIPTVAPILPDWNSSLEEAFANRPELVTARQDVKVNQLKLMSYKNNKPRISWNFGPMNGNRDADAPYRAAEMNLDRSFVGLKNQELKVERFLAAAYQNMDRYQRDIEAYRAQRMALRDQLKGLFAGFQAGKDPLIALLTAQTQFAQALANEYSSIANYNTSLAAWQYAKGTIQGYHMVSIGDGPLPNGGLPSARDYYKQQGERTAAGERAKLPASDMPPSLASLLQHAPAVPEIPAQVKPTSHKNDWRTPIMPPIRENAPPPICEDPPTDREVLRAIKQVTRGIPYVYEQSPDDVKIVSERIVDKIDPPRFFPLVGPAQLHHCRWKCTVYFTQTIQEDYPFPVKLKKRCVQVVYIDKDRLHQHVELDPEIQRQITR